MSNEFFSPTSADVVLEPGTVPAQWMLGGQPQTRSKLLGKTPDGLAFVMLWECGAVSFKWHYSRDEVFIGLSGEAFMIDERGGERRFGPGDVAFFSAGSDATWRIPDHFRKVAFLKDPVWPPVALGLKAWNRLLQMAGLSEKSPF